MSAFGGALKELYQGQLSNVLGALYTAPSQPPNTQTNVYSLWICNTDNAAHTFTLRFGGGTAADSLFDGAPIAANTTVQVDANTCLAVVPAGLTIQGNADAASKVTVSIYGEEITAS